MHRALLLGTLAALNSSCSLDYGAFDVENGGTGASGGTGAAATGGAGGSATGGAGATGGGTAGSGNTGAMGSGGAGGGPSGGAGGTAGSGGGFDCGVLTYSPSSADCVDLTDPDPNDCTEQFGSNQIILDAVYSAGGGGKHVIYLRFDLDAAFVTSSVTSVQLSLTTSAVEGGGQNPSGTVWTVDTFTRPDLFSMVSLPGDIANVAADVGPIGGNTTATWSLPTDVVAPNAALTLRLEPPPGSNDGLLYWNGAGNTPPQLVVSCQ